VAGSISLYLAGQEMTYLGRLWRIETLRIVQEDGYVSAAASHRQPDKRTSYALSRAYFP